jgi:hypothetical protein
MKNSSLKWPGLAGGRSAKISYANKKGRIIPAFRQFYVSLIYGNGTGLSERLRK